MSRIKGSKHTEETKRKIMEAHLGNHYPNISKALKGRKREIFSEDWRKNISKAKSGAKNFFYGKHHSEEARKKMSEARKGKKASIKTRMRMSEALRGEKNPNWKGGRTIRDDKTRKGIEFRLWRESVFARDNWTCQKTGVKGGELNAHHIKPFSKFPELRTAIDNGITLSKKVHDGFHRKYGFKKNTKEQLEEYLRPRC